MLERQCGGAAEVTVWRWMSGLDQVKLAGLA